MKSVSLVLSIVALLAIIPLYYFQFGQKPTAATERASMGTGSAAGQIAYIHTDSLFQSYAYYDDLSAEYQTKRERIQKQLETRSNKLQNKVANVQRRAQAGLLTRNEMRSAEEELAGEQQELQIYQQTVSAGLMEEERAMNEKLFEKITKYLEGYNREKGYQVIFSYNQGGNIWIAEDALDITDEVLRGLNEQYKEEKAAQPAAEPEKK